jgi:3-hydroxy-9,10-secoandrosta-1,3,5(10)-triene-9,17-dione monooxygenase reductase component
MVVGDDSAAAGRLAPDLFREAIARFATGVTVITTLTEAGPAGMTASAVASLSLDPVLLLVCVRRGLPTHHAIEHAERFAVNVLGEGGEALARRFATPGQDKFEGVSVETDSGVPVLADALAHFICDVHECLPGGDHSIFIGAVRACEYRAAGRPLLYWGSRFGSLDHPDRGFRDMYGLQSALSM